MKSKEQIKKQQYKNSLKTLYNLSLEEYALFFRVQRECCAICGKHHSELKTKLAVDHCHKTGKVRGLLCSKCNLGLGLFQDNIKIIKKIITYLENNA